AFTTTPLLLHPHFVLRIHQNWLFKPRTPPAPTIRPWSRRHATCLIIRSVTSLPPTVRVLTRPLALCMSPRPPSSRMQLVDDRRQHLIQRSLVARASHLKTQIQPIPDRTQTIPVTWAESALLVIHSSRGGVP